MTIRDWLIVFVMLDAWLWPPVHGSESYDRDSLDSFLYNYAYKKMPKLHAGKLFDVIPPSNFSGMEVSVVRLSARSLWMNGARYRAFVIPPRMLPWPYTKRIDILYQNLGNWSSYYYSVPNYTLIAPVIGFLTYDSNRRSMNNGLIELKTEGGDPFIVTFPSIYSQEGGDVSMKCVRFDTNGSLEFSSVTVESSCVVREQGHFSVVVPYKPSDDKGRKWKIMGIAAGVVGLVFVLVIGVMGYKWIRRKKMKKMEMECERSEVLDTIWIGRSRMPYASGIRTQPVIESSYVP